MQINEKQAKAEGYQLKQVKNHENHCGGIKTNENQHISPQVNRLEQAKTIEKILKSLQSDGTQRKSQTTIGDHRKGKESDENQ